MSVLLGILAGVIVTSPRVPLFLRVLIGVAFAAMLVGQMVSP